MAFRLPARSLAAAASRRCSSSQAVAGSNLSQAARQAIARDAALPNPDPAEDSASAALVGEHAKYMLATYARPPPVFAGLTSSFVRFTSWRAWRAGATSRVSRGGSPAAGLPGRAC